MNTRLFLFLFLSFLILYLHSLYIQKRRAQLAKMPAEPKAEAVQKLPKEPIIAPSEKERLLIRKDELSIESPLFAATLLSDGSMENLYLLRFKERERPYPIIEKKSFSLMIGDRELYPVSFSSESSYTKEFVYHIAGVKLIKRYTFDPSSYLFKLNLSFVNETDNPILTPPISLRLEPALGKDPKLSGSPHSYMAHQKVKDVRYKGGGFLSAIGITKRPPSFQRIEITEPIDWIIQKEKYFLFVMIPKMRPKRCSFFKYEDGGFGIDALFGEYRLEPRAYLNNTIQIYAGPKDHRILENYGLMKLSGLWFLARITLSILSFFHSIVGNYGIAIIFLTILTKVVLHPLTRKNFKVMKQMARLKPHMERLRAKHKDDHQTLQREMMKLYKEHNVNPFGGCLPLLLQLPVFFALFSALNNGIELRGAPFVFWIRDLSARDPYFILPILMGATMFIQQKMSPTAGDPSTEKMMLILPIVFTFLFLSFPSGLVLYWLTQNILTIFEHWLIEKGIER